MTSPIVLLDPPKFKLKRQLSIETSERSEALRIHKKAAISDRALSPRKRVEGERKPGTSDINEKIREDYSTDEVDGSAPSLSSR